MRRVLTRSLRTCATAALVAALVLSPVAAFAKPLATDLVADSTADALGVQLSSFPDVQMASGMLVTADGTLLWARNSDSRRAIASITKVMTAVVALESGSLDDVVTIPKDSSRVGESTSNLVAGSKLPLSEVLEGLLVKSGNDAAVAIAVHVAGSEAAFVDMMNAKAVELGLTDTVFANPHGLDHPGEYSTARDLATLARYAMSKPEFRRIVGTKSAQVGDKGPEVTNTNVLLGNYEGANGVKTGWTNKAGYCVIDSAQRDGLELYAIVLGTDSELQRFRDARELLDWGFAHYRSQQVLSSGTVIGEAPVSDYLDTTVGAQSAADQSVRVLDFKGPIKRSVSVATVKAPVTAGDKVGVVTFVQGDRVILTAPLVATADVDAPDPFQRVGIWVTRVWRKVFGGRLVAPPVTASAVL